MEFLHQNDDVLMGSHHRCTVHVATGQEAQAAYWASPRDVVVVKAQPDQPNSRNVRSLSERGTSIMHATSCVRLAG